MARAEWKTKAEYLSARPEFLCPIEIKFVTGLTTQLSPKISPKQKSWLEALHFKVTILEKM